MYDTDGNLALAAWLASLLVFALLLLAALLLLGAF